MTHKEELNNLELEKSQEKFQEKIENFSEKITKIKKQVAKKIVAQEDFVEKLLIWLFSKWHILVEWLPGLAKTLTVDTLSKTLDLGFNRLQFTPDLLPSDLIWTEIFNTKTNNFEIKKWPIFNNFILADEINRAPSKVQSALLEAMAEKHITIWKETFVLDKPFIVLATQNPIEQSGTYRLPEAQLDRFMFKLKINYPSYEEELLMYKKISEENDIEIKKILDKKDIIDIQNLSSEIFVSDSIYKYITNLVDATRNPEKYDLEEIKKYIDFWSSPRWWLSLISASKTFAFMNSRSFVIPEDVKFLAKDILSHRLVLSYEAVADSIDERQIIEKILEKIKII